MHRNEEMLAAQHYEESSPNLSGKSAQLGASLKWLYANAYSVGNKPEELHICLQLQGYGFIGVTEVWWDSSWDWSVAMYVYSSSGKTGAGKTRCRIILYVRDQWECVELCTGTELSQLRAYGSGLVGRPIWVTSWGCLLQITWWGRSKEWSHLKAIEKHHHFKGSGPHWEAWTTLVSAEGTTWRLYSNPGSFWSVVTS